VIRGGSTECPSISAYHPGGLWRLRIAQEVWRVEPEDVVLDAGCADGYVSRALAERARAVVGVDIAPEVIEHNQRLPGPPNLQFVCADLNAVEELCEPGAFTKILCMDVLEHAVGFERIIAAFARLLADGGLLLLTIPVRGHGHLAHTPGEVRAILCRSGLSLATFARVEPPGWTRRAIAIFEMARRIHAGRASEVDRWSETRAYRVMRERPLALRVYQRSIFPLLRRLVAVDAGPYRETPKGRWLLVLAEQIRQVRRAS
jgi:SAM-dependent methyltransferase